MSEDLSLSASLHESVPLSQEELIALLDPKRGYGARTYEEVVGGIRGGELLIQPGGHLPVLKDGVTGRTIKGTGVVPGSGSKEGMNRVRARFNAHFDEDEDAWYEALYDAGVNQRDPRAIKIAYEMRIGKPGESRSSGDARILDRLFELATAKGEARSERPITVVEVKPE